MNFKIKKILKVFLIGVALFVSINWFIQRPNDIIGYFQIVFESSGVSTLVVVLYNNYVWKFDFTNGLPKLDGDYKGHIAYEYNGISSKKEVEVKISQTFLDIQISIISNEITSSTITSEIIKENSNYIIYYTYITNPKIEFANENPIQRGTCRLEIIDNRLEGVYWTSRKTMGDIVLTKRN